MDLFSFGWTSMGQSIAPVHFQIVPDSFGTERFVSRDCILEGYPFVGS